MNVAAGVLLIIAAIFNLIGGCTCVLTFRGLLEVLWGFVLFGISGIMIGGAVCSFMKKTKGFVLATGVLAIIAGVVGYGNKLDEISSVVGLVAGVFVFIAIRSFPSQDNNELRE
jgi:hypothetical protein